VSRLKNKEESAYLKIALILPQVCLMPEIFGIAARDLVQAKFPSLSTVLIL